MNLRSRFLQWIALKGYRLTVRMGRHTRTQYILELKDRVPGSTLADAEAQLWHMEQKTGERLPE
jgi:hypothetical protein